LYSPRFSLPDGAWTLRVESQSEAGPNVLNVCRLSLVTDDENAAPLASAMLKIGSNLESIDFTIAKRENRVHLKGEGLQLKTRIMKATLVRVARSGG
jgi:hypothetical protein